MDKAMAASNKMKRDEDIKENLEEDHSVQLAKGKPQKIELAIQGMTCAACATRIEKGLNKLEGVNLANVNLALEKGLVEYNPALISIEKIVEKVQDLGYQAQRIMEENESKIEDLKVAEIERQQSRFIYSAVFSLPLLWIMLAHFFTDNWVPTTLMNPWIQFAFATPVQFWIGGPFYRGAYQALKNGSANMDVLVALGTSAAYFFSVVQVLRGRNQDLYFETSAIILTLIVLGKLLETQAKGRTSEAIKKLMDLRATNALVIRWIGACATH